MNELKVSDKVNIIYITQMNCEPKRRKLNNLTIVEIKPDSIVFLQGKRRYEISKDCIKVINTSNFKNTFIK